MTTAIDLPYRDTTQIISLEGIAQQCPEERGLAVYIARALLEHTGNFHYRDPVLHQLIGQRNADVPKPKVRAFQTAERVRIYPNPAGELIQIVLPRQWTAEQDALLTLRNLNGHTLQNLVIPQGQHQLEVITGSLPSGVYLITIASRNENRNLGVTRLVILH